MAKRMTIMLAIVSIIFGGAIAWYFVKQEMIAKFLATMKYPPATVTVTSVKASNWQPYYESVGTFVAPQSVSLTPEASGVVDNIYFQSGDVVQKGQLLLTLDSRQEQANLASAQASLHLAQLNYKRDQQLYSQRAISKQAMDATFAELQQDQAAVRSAQVIIEQKQVRAPFAGKLGIRLVSLGQFVATGSNPNIATLEQVNPLFLDFDLPQQDVSNIKIGQPIEANIDGYDSSVFKGKITAIDVGVNQDSRMITVRASLPNDDQLLRSGMFADVKILLPTQQAVITVPQTAISYNLYGDLVYVIKNGKAFQTFVTVGQRRGDEVEVIKGLNIGDQVVTAGQLKLFNEAPVVISKEMESTNRG